MGSVLLVTFPFFALVLCGHVAARRGWVPLAAIPGLNGFVLFFALPCLLFRFGSGTPLAQLFNPGTFFTYLLCALVVVGVVVAWARHRGLGWLDAAFGALVAAFPNSGFMGVPLLVALMGAGAAGTVIVTIGVDMVITTSLCLAISRIGRGGATGWDGLRQSMRGVASNPMPWAIAAGALFSGMGWALWEPLGRVVALLADAASPVALFTIGAVLARSQMTTSAASRHAHQDFWGVAAIKLFAHPLLVLAVGSAALWLGWLDRFTLTVLVMVAALPSASNVSLLAERCGADNARVARIILVSTAAAFFSFSAVVSVLR
jgi:malonate transporter and related proteins